MFIRCEAHACLFLVSSFLQEETALFGSGQGDAFGNYRVGYVSASIVRRRWLESDDLRERAFGEGERTEENVNEIAGEDE